MVPPEMESAADRLTALALKPGRHAPAFDLVIAVAFYDGPEDGIALYRSGHAVRFDALGDSRSRMFRAYALAALDGVDWWRMAMNLPELANSSAPGGLCLPSADSEALQVLERRLLEASPVAHFVATGDPYLRCLGIRAVLEGDVRGIRQMNDWTQGFRRAHQLVKERSP